MAYELLGAVCHVRNGYDRTLRAFDSYKVLYNEPQRFDPIMRALRDHASDLSASKREFQIACLVLLNVLVYSCDDLNKRVVLQVRQGLWCRCLPVSGS